MNSCILSGIVTQVYFDTVGEGKQPFLSFLLRVRGPKIEGPSIARVVMFGENAERMYPLLREGQQVEVEARFRARRNRQPPAVAYEFVARRIEFPTIHEGDTDHAN